MPTHPSSIYSANGIRTRVWALRGPRPSPLDDSAAITQQARRESNPQPPVLETGALPIELRTFSRTATSCELRNTTNCGQLGSVRHSEFVLQGWLTGIEPATPGATDRCSNQLSYSHHEPLCILTALDNRINGVSPSRTVAHGQSEQVLRREYARSGGAPNCAPSLRSVAGLLVAR